MSDTSFGVVLLGMQSIKGGGSSQFLKNVLC